MLISQRPTLSEDILTDSRSQFVIEPLEPGFGYTLGNSLRRTLLSSIPGAAVTSIRIDGVLHEFTTVPGVKEDVTDIILNLKGLVVSSEEDEPVTMYLRKQGPGEVTAGDIVPPAGVTVHNPDMHIATLNDKGKLEVELVVERGRGYVPAVQNRASGAEIGRIPVDSIYSPVLKVTYKVDATRVEQRTDFDKLILDVETKSSITPRDALASAGKTLVELFGLARELNVEAEGIEIGPSPAEADHIASFALPIDDLDLTVRSYNCLKREGVHTVGELVSRTESDLLDIRNFGQKSIDEVKVKLHQLGLSLKDSPPTFDPSEVAGYDVATGTWSTDGAYDDAGLRRNRTALTRIPCRPYLIRGPALDRSVSNAQAHQGPSPRRVVFAPEGAAGQPGHVAVRARPDQDDRAEGACAAAVRGEADHPRQEGHAAQPSRGAEEDPRQGRGARLVRRDRAVLRRPRRRLHPHHQGRGAQGRQRPDGRDRAGAGEDGDVGGRSGAPGRRLRPRTRRAGWRQRRHRGGGRRGAEAVAEDPTAEEATAEAEAEDGPKPRPEAGRRRG